jgi:hypothetical protein
VDSHASENGFESDENIPIPRRALVLTVAYLIQGIGFALLLLIRLKNAVEICKMCAILPSLWVRKLIGKLRVPYKRGLQVRGSSHPYFERDYEPFLPPFAAASKVFRIHSDLLCRA